MKEDLSELKNDLEGLMNRTERTTTQRVLARALSEHFRPKPVTEGQIHAAWRSVRSILGADIVEGESPDDVLQRVALDVLNREPQSVQNPAWYFRQACRNRAVRIKKQARTRSVSSWCLSIEGHEELPPLRFLGERKAIRKALRDLSAEDQRILQMLFVEERSQKDIAAALGLSHVAVRVRVFRALRTLASSLSKILSTAERT